MSEWIHEYVVTRKGKRKGALVAARATDGSGRIAIGTSLCRLNVDTFNREAAIEIALTRATLLANGERNIRCPISMYAQLGRMVIRAAKYFRVPLSSIIVPN